MSQLVEQRDQVGTGKDRRFAALVEVEAAGKHRKPGLDGAVKQVRFCEAEGQRPLATAQLRVEAKRLAQTQEVVRRVAETDEAAREARDAAVEADGVLAALLDLEGQVDDSLTRIATNVGRVIVFFCDGLEVAKLVEPKDAQVPQARVEHVAFVQQQLTTDHLVAGGVVSGEVDAADKELLALVDRQVEVDLRRIVAVVKLEVRLAHEVDVAELSVELLEILHAITEIFDVEDIALPHLKDALENRGAAKQLDVSEAQLAESVFLALVEKDRDVGLLARPLGDHGYWKQLPAGHIVGVEFMAGDGRLEIAPLLVGVTNHLLRHFELVDVEGFLEHLFEEDAAR